MQRKSQRRTTSMRIGRACAGVTALALVSVGGCAEQSCPETTEELRPVEVDLYRQLEVCASRVTGVPLHRDDLPRVETDPDLVACNHTPSGFCVKTQAGQPVAGFYEPNCDTFTVAMREILYHEMLHPVLCGAPGFDCDPGHTSPAWLKCLQLKQCPEGRIIVAERVCDGTPDCAQGEDELQCP